MVRMLLAFVVLCATATSLFAQGTLQRARSTTRDAPSPPQAPEPAPSANSGPPNRTNNDTWTPQGGGPTGDAWGGLLLCAGIVATCPIWLPIVALGDNYDRRTYFPAHPYALSEKSYPAVLSGPPMNCDTSWYDRDFLKPFAVRLAVENSNDLGGLNRLSGRLQLDTAWRMGFSANMTWLNERLPCGCVDSAGMGEYNLTYRFAQCEWMVMHAGLGFRNLFDGNRDVLGVNFLYSADLFRMDPVVVSTQLDLGNLQDAFVVRARATIGWQLRYFELYAGYDFLRIGEVNIQGPVAGLRLWF